jgi:hypothetical protein
MAKTFQDMLECFGLAEKILAVIADNATANDTQTTKLSTLDNSFEEENRARCFNHTVQLSVKTLLKPFNMALSGKATYVDEMVEEDDDDQLIPEIDEGEDDEDEVDEEKDDEDDGIDELEQLSENEQEQVLKDTAAVRGTVTKVCPHETEDVCIYCIADGIPTGSTTFFCHYPFNNNHAPYMASHLH